MHLKHAVMQQNWLKMYAQLCIIRAHSQAFHLRTYGRTGTSGFIKPPLIVSRSSAVMAFFMENGKAESSRFRRREEFTAHEFCQPALPERRGPGVEKLLKLHGKDRKMRKLRSLSISGDVAWRKLPFLFIETSIWDWKDSRAVLKRWMKTSHDPK